MKRHNGRLSCFAFDGAVLSEEEAADRFWLDLFRLALGRGVSRATFDPLLLPLLFRWLLDLSLMMFSVTFW